MLILCLCVRNLLEVGMSKLTKFNSAIVHQHNKLIEAKFTSQMSEQVQKVIAYIVSETKKSDMKLFEENRNKEIALSAKDFAYILKTKPSAIYRDAEELSKVIQEKRLLVKYIGIDNKEAFEEITVIPYMKYEAGVLTITVNSKILKYLLEVKEHFTAFKLEHVLRLGSAYAIKMYQLLKQYENIGERKFEIDGPDGLKDTLGIRSVKSYELYGQFKRDVLEQSKKHINLHTDINVDYEEIKKGRKVFQVKFFIKPKLTQFDQAVVGFGLLINELPEASIIRIKWSNLKGKERLKFFEPYINKWAMLQDSNYHKDAIDLLNVYDRSSIFYPQEELKILLTEMSNDFLKKK